MCAGGTIVVPRILKTNGVVHPPVPKRVRCLLQILQFYGRQTQLGDSKNHLALSFVSETGTQIPICGRANQHTQHARQHHLNSPA